MYFKTKLFVKRLKSLLQNRVFIWLSRGLVATGPTPGLSGKGRARWLGMAWREQNSPSLGSRLDRWIIASSS